MECVIKQCAPDYRHEYNSSAPPFCTYAFHQALIGTHDIIYRLSTHSIQVLAHDSTSSCELSHNRFAHLNFRTLSSMEKVAVGLPKLNLDYEGIQKGHALGKSIKHSFYSSESTAKDILS